MRCKSCGDNFEPTKRRQSLDQRGLVFMEGEQLYCLECANELFRGKISTRPAQLYSAGGGCQLEKDGSDDPSPWEENNIRIMEGD